MHAMNRRMTSVVLVIFFLSGLSSLLYQIVWLKELGYIFGNTVQAAATLIAVFLAGLGIGSFLFSRKLLRISPLLLYAALEALIGLYGSFAPLGFDRLDDLYVWFYQSVSDASGPIALMRVAASSLFLLVPTILMGATLPVMVRWWSRPEESAGQGVSRLYSANTFGATSGVALAGFVTIPLIGVAATTFLAVSLNFTLALAAALLHYVQKAPQTESSSPRTVAPQLLGKPIVLLAAFIMGMSSIADEVFWSRILVLHLGSSVYAYSLMLCSFLVGIAIGSALVYRLIEKTAAWKLLVYLELGLAVVLALQIAYLLELADVIFTLATWIGIESQAHVVSVLGIAVFSALGIPTILMGATFPVTVRLYAEGGRSETDSTGVVYFFNTVGSIIGSFLAGFLLIPWIGSQNGLFLMATMNLIVAALILRHARLRGEREKGRRGQLLAASVAIVAAVWIMVPPSGVILSTGAYAEAGNRVLFVREDVTATVALREFENGALSLELNGVNVAGTSPALIGTQKLQGHLPLLMHSDPKSVLHIGFGSGGTAHAVSLHDEVEQIVIAEISPEVLEASDRYLRVVNKGVLDDPRVVTTINDGRNFVLATPRRFDVILSDSIHPRYAGNGSLYTQDYFELCRDVLNPGGVISMWLPTYSLTSTNYLMIVEAFRRVFPNATVWYVPNDVNAFTIVIGRTEAGPIPFDRIARGFEGAVLEDLKEIGIADPYDLARAMLIDPVGVEALGRSVPAHVDDLPAVEYESGRLIDREASWYANFEILARAMTPLPRNFLGIPDLGRMEAIERERLNLVLDHLQKLRERLRQRATRPSDLSDSSEISE